MKILGAELAAAVAERERVSTAMSALQRRVAEQEREVKGLTTELKEAREMAAATATAAEDSVAESRQVCTWWWCCVLLRRMTPPYLVYDT